MTMADPQVASITRPLVLLVLVVDVEVDLARRGMVVVHARRDRGSGVGQLVQVRRSSRHANHERANHYCQNRQKVSQSQHAGCL
jgi:hypothetical protein